MKSSTWDLKNAETSTNPQTVKRYEAGICISHFFFSDHLYKTNRFHVAVGLFSNTDHRGRQNVVKTSVIHEPHFIVFTTF